MLGLQGCAPHLVVCCAGNQIQSYMHTKPEFYQVNYIHRRLPPLSSCCFCFPAPWAFRVMKEIHHQLPYVPNCQPTIKINLPSSRSCLQFPVINLKYIYPIGLDLQKTLAWIFIFLSPSIWIDIFLMKYTLITVFLLYIPSSPSHPPLPSRSIPCLSSEKNRVLRSNNKT